MSDEMQQILCTLVREHGAAALLADANQCRGLLTDNISHHFTQDKLLAEQLREVYLLFYAVEEGVAADVQATNALSAAMQASLAQRLHERRDIGEHEARWTVDTWALALGKTPVTAHSALPHNVGEATPAGKGVENEDKINAPTVRLPPDGVKVSVNTLVGVLLCLTGWMPGVSFLAPIIFTILAIRAWVKNVKQANGSVNRKAITNNIVILILSILAFIAAIINYIALSNSSYDNNGENFGISLFVCFIINLILAIIAMSASKKPATKAASEIRVGNGVWLLLFFTFMPFTGSITAVIFLIIASRALIVNSRNGFEKNEIYKHNLTTAILSVVSLILNIVISINVCKS